MVYTVVMDIITEVPGVEHKPAQDDNVHSSQAGLGTFRTRMGF